MTDFVVSMVLALVLGSSILYIVKAKKNGVKCIGCASGQTCGKCNCHK